LNIAGPLEGIRVLEFASHINGPSASAFLADYGAEVIKVEDRNRGDGTRGFVSYGGDPMNLAGGLNVVFEAYNRNKRDITLDLAKEKGLEIMYRLAKKSDVFLTNYRDNLLARLKVDYDTLHKLNPRLIYAVGSGYGSKGPENERRTFDWAGQARSGIMSMTGEREGPPGLIIGNVVDQIGGQFLASGVLLALLAREKFGFGQRVDASMLGGALLVQLSSLAPSLWRGRSPSRHSSQRAKNAFANYYKCSDNKWIILSEPQVQRFWPQLCKAMGITELENDPRFNTIKGQRTNCIELISIIKRVMATKTCAEWEDILGRQVGISCSPVFGMEDLVNDPQILENEYIVEFDHPVLGRIKVPGFPIGLSETRPSVRTAPPQFGQNTEEILQEIGGYNWDEITEFREQEVI
jgi:crotonobetainyl-CoA:carnitine CoA-transferase CaiB-like acyl-CoA transferase